MIKAVIFDMDGVMIDSDAEYLRYGLEFAQAKNPAVRLEQLFPMVGATSAVAWSCMADAIGNGQTWKELLDEFRAGFDIYTRMDYRKIFRPRIRGLLNHLPLYRRGPGCGRERMLRHRGFHLWYSGGIPGRNEGRCSD